MGAYTAWTLHPVMTAFLLTVSMSLLLGLGLREYYLINQKRIVFGSTRTCMLIGLIGFVLFHTRPDSLLYLCGLVVLGFWLGLFYHYKLAHEQTGLIGLLLALISYTLGPVSLTLPTWFLLLYVIAALFILNAKANIQLLTLRLANEEVITLAKFLVLAGVILPLTSQEPLGGCPRTHNPKLSPLHILPILIDQYYPGLFTKKGEPRLSH
jgi:hypothetical protein